VNQSKNLAETRVAEELHREIIKEAERRHVEIARYHEEADHAQRMEAMQIMEEERERQLAECRTVQSRIEREIEEAHRREMESIQALMAQPPPLGSELLHVIVNRILYKIPCSYVKYSLLCL
jgi:hypothetical protein